MQNLQYATALSNRIFKLYQDSWIAKYFNVDVRKQDNNVVYFYDLQTKAASTSYRYIVLVYIPERSKPYFLSKADWNQLLLSADEHNISTDLLSSVTHGFRTLPATATKSLFYNPPYFVKLKTPIKTPVNYMVYQKQFKHNLESTILAMLVPVDDVLTAQFAPNLTIPFVNALLNSTLEFVILDSDMQQLSIEDGSQLFFSITVV